MDIKQSDTYRNKELRKLTIDGSNKYDYEKNGVLNKVLPKILFKGNSIFVTFLQLIDLRIIMMLKTVNLLNHFKRVSDY